MKICGLNKTTLLDYPGKVAATVFVTGCDFRCPFCHNSSLVLHGDLEPEIPKEEILSFLKKRKGILEGVCITGGEPCLYPELPDLLSEIKELGYAVKVDTNGSRPEMIRLLAENHLADKIAMDVKACPENYERVCGISPLDLDPVLESVEYLKAGPLDYEFRTTVVKELHTEKDFSMIGQWLVGAKCYYLQAYKDSPGVMKPGFSSYSLEELTSFQNLLKKTIPLVEIRGID